MPARPSSPRLPTSSQLQAVRSRLRLSIRDAGLTDLRPADASPSEARFWDIEPTPLIIDAAEWKLLVAALQQRARFVNAFLTDLYTRQGALKQRLLPPEAVLADPYYRRPCLGLEPDRSSPAMLLRFDLMKTADGWVFVSTKANTPIGLSYAVQNRRFMTQEAAELYHNLPDYHSVINFPLQLLDSLHQLAPGAKRAPSIVVLTAGPRDPFYSEHSFLARKMGLPLVCGDDLLVLDNCVYLKTIAGLERVDVIYRRLNDAHIDPVVFSTDRESVGIPGLMQCIRARTVVLANAIGSGVAESRAIDVYLPRLMRFHLGESPLLPSIPTHTCGDTDQLDYILDHRKDFVVRPVHDPRLGDPRPGPGAAELLGERGLAQVVKENPHAFVAQQRLAALPLNPGSKKAPPFRLSAFVLARGRHFDVFPGGLVRIGPDEPPVDRVGVTADVLVLTPTDTGAGGVADIEAVVTGGVTVTTLGSRSAEHLFWLGRYLERAEAAARMLAILNDVALEEIPPSDRRRWLPVWRGLLEATGHTSEKIRARASPQATLSLELTWRMTLDLENPSSIRSSVASACDNARQLRDIVSPESWTVLTRLHDRLNHLARRKPRETAPADQRNNPSASLGIDEVLGDINAFLGTAERTMLHDEGWHFLRMGMHLERAIMTCSALRHLLGVHGSAVETSSVLIYRDNPELSALLRMLGSQDVYRRLYQTRSQPRLVAELFLREPNAPRSIHANLQQIHASLQAVHEAMEEQAEEPTILAVADALAWLDALRLDRHFGARDAEPAEEGQTLHELLAELLGRLYSLHPLLSDHYFSHQARLTAGPTQEELVL